MDKDSMSNAIVITTIIVGVMGFLISPKTLNSFLVFSGFLLSSGYWLTHLWKDKLTPSKDYLCMMGVILQLSYSSVYSPIWIIWVNVGLFVFFCFAFVITYYSEVGEAVTGGNGHANRTKIS